MTTLPPFKEWLFKDQFNKRVLWIASIAMVIQFVIFKYFYPFPSFIFGDSFSYLDTATKNLDINTYMVGYSRFLRLFSALTSSDTILIAAQFLFIQGGVFFFLFSLFYFYKPGRNVQIILCAFMIFNPLFIYMSNLISSDGFFLSLSMIWLTLLLWIIYRPSNKIIFLLTIVLFIAFTVRYNALIYPFITVVVFLFSKIPIRKKIAGIIASTVFCSLFVIYTSYKYMKLTGTWQYSPFSGWQLANNAMYAYRYVDIPSRKPVPIRFKELDNMIRIYFDSTRDIKKYPSEAVMASTFYMWSPGMPLFRYKDWVFRNDTISSEFKKWSSMGPIYNDYGMHIIKMYFPQYVKYFLWPNLNKYYAPPVEFLESYNSGYGYVGNVAVLWFNYKNSKIITRTNDFNINTLRFYPILAGVSNVIMIFSIFYFICLGGFKLNIELRMGVILAIILWLLNATFTVLSSSAALRFQAFPILFTIAFEALIIDWIVEMLIRKERVIDKQRNLQYER